MANLVNLIKQAATEAVDASMPTAIFYGTVIKTNPLEINIEQKITLTEEFLILTNAVKDHDVYMSVDHETEIVELDANHNHETENNTSASISTVNIDLKHKHAYKGKKLFKVHNALRTNEKVILLRVQSGQKYIVIDRL